MVVTGIKVSKGCMAPVLNCCHFHSIHNFLDSMVSVVKDPILEVIMSSPGKLYGLMTDERAGSGWSSGSVPDRDVNRGPVGQI